MTIGTKKNTTLAINAAQTILLQTYESGEYSHLASSESQAALLNSIKEEGDGLLSFLVFELSDVEDCDNVEDAIARVKTAISQLQHVELGLSNYTESPAVPRG